MSPKIAEKQVACWLHFAFHASCAVLGWRQRDWQKRVAVSMLFQLESDAGERSSPGSSGGWMREWLREDIGTVAVFLQVFDPTDGPCLNFLAICHFISCQVFNFCLLEVTPL